MASIDELTKESGFDGGITVEDPSAGFINEQEAEERRGEGSRVGRSFSELPVEVRVEIGSLALCINDLVDLSEGQIFEYEFDPEQKAKLIVGGETIAETLFVYEGEQLYLQVVSVAE